MRSCWLGLGTTSALNKLEEAQRLKPRESVGRYLDEVRKAAEFKAASKD